MQTADVLVDKDCIQEVALRLSQLLADVLDLLACHHPHARRPTVLHAQLDYERASDAPWSDAASDSGNRLYAIGLLTKVRLP